MATRPIRCLYVDKSTSRLVYHRPNYNGSYTSHEITKKKKRKSKQSQENNMLMEELKFLYDAPIPIPKAKYNDLQSLTKFLTSTEAKNFYKNLTWNGQTRD